MKTLTERSAKIMAVKRLLSSSAESLEGHEAGLELRSRFLEKSEALNRLLQQLVVPFAATYSERIESRAAYLEVLHALISMGMMIAGRSADSALMLEFKSYNHRIKEASAARILAIGQAVEQFVQQNGDALSALGVSKQKQQQLSLLKKQYESAIKQATNAADDRRNLNWDIKQLIKEFNHIMRWELDIYLRLNSAHFPALYAHYSYLRNPKRRQKPKPKQAEVPENPVVSAVSSKTLTLPDNFILRQLSQQKETRQLVEPNNTPHGKSSQALKWLIPPEAPQPDLLLG